MAKTERELTVPERRSIRKLVTGSCANYDRDYGCLPLDCECPMLGICYTNSAMCRYFREAVLPHGPELEAALQALPTKRCQHLKKWTTQYAPKTTEDSLDDRFVESCQQYDRIAGLLEMLDEARPTQRSHTVSALTADGSVAFWEGVVAENRKEARYRAKEPAIA